MDAARQHALHWAFFMDIMDMSFDDIFDMFSAWYDSLPEDKMAEIMDLADSTTDNGNTKDIPETLYTEAEIWNDSGTDFSLN